MLGPTHRAFATTIAATTVVTLSLPLSNTLKNGVKWILC